MKLKKYTKKVAAFNWSGPYDGMGSHPRWCCDHAELQGLDVTELPSREPGQPLELQVNVRGQGALAVIASCLSGSRVKFADKDELAMVLLTLVRVHQTAVAAVPVPPELFEFIQRQLHDIREQASALRTQCFTNRLQQQRLVAAAKALKVPIDDEEFGTADAALKAINEYTLTGGEAPFFSEATLYPLLGKGDARSVLALLGNLKRAADPVNGAN